MTAHSGEGQTLFEMARDKLAGWWFGVKPEPPAAPKQNPVPKNFYNPLRFVPGGYLKIGDDDDLYDKLFELVSMFELTRIIDNKPFKMTDYSLRCKAYGKGPDIWRVVRVMDKGDGTFDCVLYTRYKEFDYDKDFEALLEGPQLADNISETEQVVYDKQGVYKTSARELTQDGVKPSSGTKYWDFVRNEDDAVRILCVEMDLDNGSFVLYQGRMIDPLDVTGTSGHTAAAA